MSSESLEGLTRREFIKATLFGTAAQFIPRGIGLLAGQDNKSKKEFDKSSDKIIKEGDKEYTLHPVKKDETFWQYRTVYGVSVEEIKKANPNVDPNNLQIGSIVKIPIKKEYSDITIILDAGHGGKDPGAVRKYKGKEYYEKDFTLDYSKSLASKLREKGFKVVETRTKDNYIKLKDRSTTANKYNGPCISIHLNSGKSSASGSEVLYENNPKKTKPLAELIMKYLTPIIGKHGKTGVYTPKQIGKKTRHMTREPKQGVIVELGFLSNDKDLNNLLNRKKDIVGALYNALLEYVKPQKK